MTGVFAAGAQVVALRVVGAALGVLAAAVLGRALGPEGYGAYTYLLIVLTLLGVPISNGWATMLLRRVAAFDPATGWSEAKGMMVRGTVVAAGFSALVASVIVAYVEVAGADDGPLATLGLGIGVGLLAIMFLDQLSALRAAVLRGLNLPVLAHLPEMIARPAVLVAAFLVQVTLLGMPPTLGTAVASLAIAAGAAALLGSSVLAASAPKGLAEAAPESHPARWARSSMLLGTGAALVMLNTYVDTVMLGALGTLADVGVYRVAVLASIVSGFVYTAFNIVAAQRFAQLHASGDDAGLQATAALMARVAVLGALPLPLVFWFYGEELIGLAFGAAFVGALAPMAPLFLSQLANAAFGMSRNLLVMTGHEGRAVRATVVAVATNAIACLVLIPRFGALGAALASSASTILLNALLWHQSRRLTGIDTSILNLRTGRA